MENKKILITGATGFLGKYVVDIFLENNFEVYALGRNEKKGEELKKCGVNFIKADFQNLDDVDKYFENMDIVIHAGALSDAWGRWEDFYNVNVLGTQNVIKACQNHNVERLIYISSPSVYSEKRDRFNVKEDEYNENNELNFYIKSKILAEKEVEKAKDLYSVILRPRGLFGVGDTSIIPRILRANAKTGMPIINNGENMVDITYVENVAYAIYLSSIKEDIDKQVFNITNDEPMKFKEILETFLVSIGQYPKYIKLKSETLYNMASVLENTYKAFRISKEPVFTKYTACTLAYSQTLDITKAKTLLGYRPIKTIREGIDIYGKWWNENN